VGFKDQAFLDLVTVPHLSQQINLGTVDFSFILLSLNFSLEVALFQLSKLQVKLQVMEPLEA
jgi:hypothetical protein